MTEERLVLAELLEKAGDGDFLRAVAEAVLQLLMETDVEGVIGAGRYEQRRAHDLAERLPRPDLGNAPGAGDRRDHRVGRCDRCDRSEGGRRCRCRAGPILGGDLDDQGMAEVGHAGPVGE